MASIDVEDENILTTIFKNAFPASWQENPDFLQYLVELSSCGVEKLAREPDRLADECAQVLEETQDLAFHNYTTFIQTADCSKEIFQDIIEKNLDNVLDKLPPFAEECNTVVKKAQEISSSRQMNTLTLQRHTQLLEILEMPQLMDTCVRNGYYEEALELTSHVKRLEKKLSHIPVIMSIVNDIKNSTQLMLNELLQQLRTNLQLPACLRVIGYLRQMDVFTEAELRIKFLQTRDSWFQNILNTIPKNDAYLHITKIIEASRVHLFDIITQYRAIFSDEDPLLSVSRDDVINETALFHGWVVRKVSQFLTSLEYDLQRGVGGRLDSLLGQCMYFGLSFSRVGADFRGLLAPIFQRAATGYFQAALSEANTNFEENMQSYNLLGVTTSTGGAAAAYGSISQAGQSYPPTVLLDFYPLAAYCNHVLTAFNELRLCAPVNLACDVTDALQRSLLEVNRVILAFFRAEETTFNEQEKDQFGQFCATYITDLLPYMNKCLSTLFPPAQLAGALGISLSELSKMGNVGVVDLNAVITQVEHLIPKIEQVPPTSTGSTTTQQATSVSMSATTTPAVSVISDTFTSGPNQSEASTESSSQAIQSEVLSHPTEEPTSQSDYVLQQSLQTETLTSQSDHLIQQSLQTEALTGQSDHLRQQSLQTEALTDQSDHLRQQSLQTEALTSQSDHLRQQSLQTEGLTSQSDHLRQQSLQTETLTSQSDHLIQQSLQTETLTSQSDLLQPEVNPASIPTETSEQERAETVSDPDKDKAGDSDSSKDGQAPRDIASSPINTEPSGEVAEALTSETVVSDTIDLDNLPFEMDLGTLASSDLDSELNIDANLAQSLAANVILDSPLSSEFKQD